MRWDILIKSTWFLVFAGIATLGGFAVHAYAGSSWVYGLFTILSTALLFLGFGRGAIFFDSFIGVLLWVGFWLKFSFHTSFDEGRFNVAVGNFDGSPASLDQALLVVSCALAAILLAQVIRRRFIFSYPDSLTSISFVGLFAFYRQYRVALLVGFIIAVVVVCVTNAWFGIYQRGLVERVRLPFGLNGVFAWLLMFGMASVSAVILRFEFELNRERYWIAIVIGLLETALSNMSLWSRGMILNGSALTYGAVVLFRLSESRLRMGLATFVIVIFGTFFVGSVLSVNYLRANTYYPGYSETDVKAAVVEQTSILFLDRWVGVEAVMAVVGSTYKSWDLFRHALEEKFDQSANAFYDQHFIETSYNNARDDGLHFISLPGYVAFLFYPGSFLFLFFAIMVFSLVAAFFEFIVYHLGGKNLVFCALIAQVIAFRYTSFGYVPMQSYLLFGSIILNVLILFSFDRLLRLAYKN